MNIININNLICNFIFTLLSSADIVLILRDYTPHMHIYMLLLNIVKTLTWPKTRSQCALQRAKANGPGEEERLVIIRFGHDYDSECMKPPGCVWSGTGTKQYWDVE